MFFIKPLDKNNQINAVCIFMLFGVRCSGHCKGNLYICLETALKEKYLQNWNQNVIFATGPRAKSLSSRKICWSVAEQCNWKKFQHVPITVHP